MPAKHLLFRSEAREKLLRGASAIADAVRPTLGPRSRSVLIEKKWGQPIVCTDGVTIAKEVSLKDPEEDLGAQMLRGAAERTGDAVGDGTTMVEGLQFDHGYLSPYFVTNPEKMEAVLDEPPILLYEGKIGAVKDLLPLLEQIAKHGAPLVVVDRERTTVVGGKGDRHGIDGRCQELRTQIADTTSDYDRERLEERLAKLTGGAWRSSASERRRRPR